MLSVTPVTVFSSVHLKVCYLFCTVLCFAVVTVVTWQRAPAEPCQAVGDGPAGRSEQSGRLQRQGRPSQAVHAILRRHQPEVRDGCSSTIIEWTVGTLFSRIHTAARWALDINLTKLLEGLSVSLGVALESPPTEGPRGGSNHTSSPPHQLLMVGRNGGYCIGHRELSYKVMDRARHQTDFLFRMNARKPLLTFQ